MLAPPLFRTTQRLNIYLGVTIVGKMVLLKILRKIKRKEREMRLLMLYGMCVCDCECLEGVLEKVPSGMLFLSPCVWSSIRCACVLARMVVQRIG